jgi:HSP20 family protein
MAIVRWAPFDLASADFAGFDDLVRRTFGDFGTSLLKRGADGATAGGWSPAMDAYIDGNELHVKLEVPGVNVDEDIDIEVEGGVLRISGERKQDTTSEGAGWFRREMSRGRFERRIGLPEGIDPETVRAACESGILEVVVPLPAAEKKKVKVQLGNGQETKALED